MKKKIWIDITLPKDPDELGPELYAVGRGANPRGDDIEVWDSEEVNRLKRLEAKREAAKTVAKSAKSEAAE